MFEHGVRVLLHPFFQLFLDVVNLTPTQLASNGWGTTMGFLYRWWRFFEDRTTVLTVDQMLATHTVRRSSKALGRFYLSSLPGWSSRWMALWCDDKWLYVNSQWAFLHKTLEAEVVLCVWKLVDDHYWGTLYCDVSMEFSRLSKIVVLSSPLLLPLRSITFGLSIYYFERVSALIDPLPELIR